MKNILSKIYVLRTIKLAVFLAVICSVGFVNGKVYAGSNPNSSTLTVSTTGDLGISLDTLPIYPSGTFVHSDSAFGFTVKTDHYSGYSAGIRFSFDGDSILSLSFSDSNGNMIYPVPGTLEKVTEEQYRDDNYAGQNDLNNTWGFRPSKYYDATTESIIENSEGYYFSIGSSSNNFTEFTLGKTTVANPDVADEYTVDIGARIGNTTETGNYDSNFEVSYYVTVNPVLYSITYDANAGVDEVENMPENEDGLSPNSFIDLSSTTPTRQGYIFKGWCVNGSDYSFDEDGNVECETSQGQPVPFVDDFSLSINQLENDNDYVLYAAWARSITGITYMQEFKDLSPDDRANVKRSMVLNQQYQLKDSRDEKSYYIAKLADGNVWMTQNLDHDIVTTTGFYTSENTDLDLPDGANFTMNAATYTNNDHTWNGSGNAPESYDPGDLCWDGSMDYDRESEINNVTILCTSEDANEHYSVGNYYNWTAAVAMNDSSSYTIDQQDVGQSICPAGWRLPTYSGDKSYSGLASDSNLDAENVYINPVYFVYGGVWKGYSEDAGSLGYYWLSTSKVGNAAYDFRFDVNHGFYPQDTGSRSDGLFVRCVAR